ncbi:FreB protein [Gaeumannomyces tritici R3-111a-1]|uniref:FreB protein n=1 Tax=Gaeumannomyces tritici (strain R3-111a-1) TaxID=644352 RepID=J3P427_GAET3|nr:FreB protein [Gaeumannomyces tritici R3-111a-1]EJT74423.1 FreB protein [Gaeumannomyces tritici R3-111a-1]
MDIQPRWAVALGVTMLLSPAFSSPSSFQQTTPSLSPRAPEPPSGTTPPKANSTISPYNTGLNGVSQDVNMLFKDTLWWSLGIVCLIVLAVRIGEIAWSKLRQVSAMSAAVDRQNYWKVTQWSWMPSLKKHLIYAPLWKKRHNREIRLSSAFNMGTLPSRLHAVLLTLYLFSNIAYMLVLNFANENRYSFAAEVRGRSGTLAAVNMVPLLLLAARNNPLIGLLQISFDTYNLIHRWIGRTVVIETIIHTVAWLYVQLADGGWESVQHKILHDDFIASGAVGTLAFVLLVLLSFSPVRHAFYETFLNVHIILAFVAVGCTWVHCATASIPGGLPQLSWVIAIMILWMADRLARAIRTAYCNASSHGYTEAFVEAMPNEACRVRMQLPRYVDVKPGTHAYLRFASINPWENHPFSIAWVEHTPIKEVLPTVEKGEQLVLKKDLRTTVSFVIGAHTGFTRKLYNRTLEHGTRPLSLRATFEGPYAGHHSLDSFGHVILFAGATGITHQLSYLQHLMDGYNNGTVATRKIVLVWIVREYEAMEWVRPWMQTIMGLPNRKQILQIRLFVTRPKNPREIMSPSTSVGLFPGRPDIYTLIEKEVSEQVGAMCVSVCGPGSLSDDVRAAARSMQDSGHSVTFWEESFTW